MKTEKGKRFIQNGALRSEKIRLVVVNDMGIGLEKLMEYGSKEAIIQNLRDAGCSEDSIECCMACLDGNKKAKLLKRLENHRKDLLNKVHEGEKQIDCLDYLVYQINRCG